MSYFYSPSTGTSPDQYGLSLATAPASEPVSLTEIKTHCRVDISADDTKLASLIKAARETIEGDLGRRLVTQTWDLVLDQFPRCDFDISLPYGPWQSITSITYLDSSGTSTVLATTEYALDSASFAPRLYLKYGKRWPITQCIENAVTIRHVSGYTTVPEKLKQAMMMLIDHWYTTARGISSGVPLTDVPQAYKSLMSQERQSWL